MNYHILFLISTLLLAGCERFDWGISNMEKDALFEAIDDGNIVNVNLLVNNNPLLVHTKNEFGLTVLMAAVSSSERNIQVIKLILEVGVDVNEKTPEGYTALHMMVDVNGSSGTGELPYDIARLLVNEGADTEIKQHWGWTPLMRAALEGTDDEFIAILETGAQADVQYPNNSLPVFTRGMELMQVVIGEPKKVEALINKGYVVGFKHIQEAESRISDVKEDANNGKFEKSWVDSYISDINQTILLLKKACLAKTCN